ncbi:Protein WEAK CHLOROPLAST MOVEMENT UNDER BLUE LIGHT 1 like [Quillaja saponaria]|uniref:Protein WEAK CHLOROPLAST MOVEMENT UNDER BLUE LIGHT 1 like n=1 Tax=Quillaja saponaria TaxID=32244 RepID=A0AAD7L8X5_QUISA|nr:Protein WEAK CHLOROPLAST MOVEMENT UNDER BLUE LIGHT 1 like [Quillaja saponaria]
MDAKLAELFQIKQKLKIAKETATQSWLDSKPLIDELETQKSNFAIAQNRVAMSNVVISDLESQLKTTNKCIKSKMEEKHEAAKMIDEINQNLGHTRDEMERLKLDISEERRAKPKRRQALRLRRQTLQTLQLTLRAVQIESEALRESEAKAIYHINCSKCDTGIVQLSHEDYYALTRKAEDENSLAVWRVAMATEQKLEAEGKRDLALSRLKKKSYSKRSQRRGNRRSVSTKIESPIENRGAAFPKARANLSAKSDRKESPPTTTTQFRGSRSNHPKIMKKKKKASILRQIRRFFVHKIGRFFR